MSTNITRHQSGAVERAAGRALSRTNAMAAIAAEDVAAIGEVGREVRRSATQAAIERRSIEQLIPELSGQLEYLDTALLTAQVARVMRLARDL